MNKNYIWGALFVLLLVGCDGAFNETTEAEYVSRAKDFLDKNEFKSAQIELKNALSKNPNNSQARWLLGKLYLEMRHATGAEKELQKASELGVNDAAVLPLLAKALLNQKKYSDLLNMSIDGINADQPAAQVLTSRALAYFYQRENEKANIEIDAALQRFTNSPYAITAKGRMLADGGDVKKAHEYIDKALSIDGDFALAWRLRGDLFSLEGEKEKAVEAYAKITVGHYYNILDLYKKAMLLVRLQRFEEAQKDIDTLKKRAPKYPSIHYAQGVLFFYQEKLPEAQAELELVLKSNDRDAHTLFFLGTTQLRQGNIEQAKDLLTRFVSLVPRYIPGRKLLAQIKLKDKAFKEAEALIRPIADHEDEDLFAQNILASALLGQGKTDEGIRLLEKIVALDPDSAKARMRLGVGLLEFGKRESGLQNLERAVEIDPEFQQAEAMLILNHVREKELDKALKLAKTFVAKQPKNIVAHNIMAAVHMANNQVGLAKASFQAARTLMPGDPEANQSLAKIAIQEEDTEAARGYFNNILKDQPNHLDTLLKLAFFESLQGNVEEMKRILDAAIKQRPDAVEPRVILVRQYLREGEIGLARISLGDILEKHRNNPIVLGAYGEIKLAAEEFKEAKLAFQQIVELEPKTVKPHLFLARAYNGLKNSEAFKQELVTALKLDPEHLQARIVLTQQLLAEGDLDAVRKNLKSLKKTASENLEVIKLEGGLLAKSGQFQQALEIYSKLQKLQPDRVSLLLLARMQWKVGRKAEAISELEQWNKSHQKDIGLMLELASRYVEMGRLEDAKQQYQQVLSVSESNVVALNDFAWYLKETDLDKALSFAEKAYSVASESVTVLDTLAVILLEKGEVERARRFNDRALTQRPGDPTLLYHRILIMEKSGQKKKVAAELKALMKKDAKFPEQAEAEEALKRLEAE